MPATVLVVDDDPVILKLLTVNFELEGYDVCAAVDGEDALRVARDRRPEVIVSDIMMPNLSGLDLLARLAADAELAAIPVILLSAKAQLDDVRAGLAAGAVDYVTKPFEPLDLLRRVEDAIAQNQKDQP